MNAELAQRIAALSPERRRVFEELARADAAAGREPIAIVGMSARFGRARDLRELWDALCAGRDLVEEVPPERWDARAHWSADPDAPGKSVSRWGGFLPDIDRMDAAFFRISADEAERLDPQQRLLLELAWEAFEDAGVAPAALVGSDTAVFAGVTTSEYGALQWIDLERVNEHVLSGTALTNGPNRVSYFFDLRGPSMAVTTACSSSLVAVHLACRSLWDGESALALAGGVNVILSPAGAVNMSKNGLLSPDGRCRAFDAGGQGFARSEGGALVVLKPLAAAVRDNDRIYAVIRGGASNQSGRTNGLGAPNPDAQERLLRRAYEDAGVAPASVGMVEAFAAGNPLVDGMEGRILTRVLAEGRPAGTICRLGSVKSNLGHTESASGAASLVKVALSLSERVVPATLHVERPTPHMPLDPERFELARQTAPWPDGTSAAGVSSFGLGGSNAHLVLERAPARGRARVEPRAELLLVSAASAAALAERLERLADGPAGRLADGPDGRDSAIELRDLAYSCARRAHLRFRAAVVAETLADARRGLAEAAARARGASARGGARRAAFAFPDRPGDEAARLRAGGGAVAELLARLEVAVAAEAGPAGGARSAFAVEVAAAEALRACGVEPAAVSGVGAGAVAAAHVAGALSLEDAAMLLAAADRIGGVSLADAAARVRPVDASGPIDLVAAETGAVLRARDLDAAYWLDALGSGRAPAAVADAGFTWLWVSGAAGSAPAGAVRALGRTGAARTALIAATGALYEAGVEIDALRLFAGMRPRLLDLPAYPWQRTRHWFDRATAHLRAAPIPAPAEDGARGAPGPAQARPSSPEVSAPAPEATPALSGAPQPGGGPEPAPEDAGQGTGVDAWLYEVAWRRQARAVAPACSVAPEGAGRYLLFSDRGGLVRLVAERLRAAGHACELVTAGGWADPADRAAMRRILERGLDGGHFTHVVYGWGLDVADVAAAELLGNAALLHLVQAIALTADAPSPRLWIVTRGAQPVVVGARVATLQAPLWGLAKAIAFEHPELSPTRIDLEAGGGEPLHDTAEAVVEELLANDGEDQIAYREGIRHAQRLIRASAVASRQAPVIAGDATYVIAGGTGVLGAVLAEWLVACGARSLLVIARGRTAPSARLEALRRAGVRVEVAACDLADRSALGAALRRARASMPPLRGVFHAAADHDDGMLAELDQRRVRAVMAAKLPGALYLDELTVADPLDFFVLFSSAVSVLGSPGQGPAAAANAFLDALAHDRRARGLPALVVNWGPWSTGEETDSVIATVPPARGLALLAEFLAAGRTQIAVLPYRLTELIQFYPRAGNTPLFQELSSGPRLSSARGYQRHDGGDYVAPSTEVQRVIAGIWRRSLAIDRVSVRDAFFEIGGDSIMAGHIISRVNDIFGVSLTLQDAFRAFTIETLAELIESSLAEQIAQLTEEQAETLLAEAMQEEG